MDHTTVHINRDGTVTMLDQRYTADEFEKKLEEDKANGITDLLVANASTDLEWTKITTIVELHQRYDRTVNAKTTGPIN